MLWAKSPSLVLTNPQLQNPSLHLLRSLSGMAFCSQALLVVTLSAIAIVSLDVGDCCTNGSLLFQSEFGDIFYRNCPVGGATAPAFSFLASSMNGIQLWWKGCRVEWYTSNSLGKWLFEWVIVGQGAGARVWGRKGCHLLRTWEYGRYRMGNQKRKAKG